ncbi:Zinc finger protein [Quillaja saponaria]|uniref:Zinc finger protein n=1 Tax=Quillaja saponaria TaxID=32244 RepID=A0AAD7PSY9_QUISA|nr:Zinc finger protein [Quillaja saponaria]
MMTNSDPDFHFPETTNTLSAFPSSSSPQCQNPRKKRSKLIRIFDDNNPIHVQGSTSIVLKPKYVKKPDPGAPKITPPCSECGKKFWSSKALFGHMRCHPERQWRGINPPPNLRRKPVISEKDASLNGTERAMTEEDHEVAACLLLLATNGHNVNVTETRIVSSYQESEPFVGDATMNAEADGAGPSGLNCRFECSSCKKVFGSHQALGGHRASHKNVKGCFAITRSDGIGGDQDYNHNSSSGTGDEQISESQRDSQVGLEENNEINKMVMVLGSAGHKCGICLRVFSSGQALGGHKRCHWEKGDNEASVSQGISNTSPFAATKEGCGLDLNLPAPVQDDSCSSYSSALTLDLRLGL